MLFRDSTRNANLYFLFFKIKTHVYITFYNAVKTKILDRQPSLSLVVHMYFITNMALLSVINLENIVRLFFWPYLTELRNDLYIQNIKEIQNEAMFISEATIIEKKTTLQL